MSDPKVPPPQMTPAPYTADRPVEPTTNPGLKLTAEQIAELRAIDPSAATVAATPAYVKLKQEDSKREFRWADVKWFFATLATIGVFLVSAGGKAADKLNSMIDGGVAPVTRDLAAETKRNDKQDAQLEKHGEALQAVKLEQVRANTMLENLSRDRGLPVPPKVILDGGVP